ncbi:HHT1, partial [Symbiodinium microadriaticum]
MHEPENKTVALDSLRSVTATYPKINCVIYDRMCSLLPSASRRKDLAQAGEVLVCGHVPRQTPLFQVRLLPVQRLKNVNTSVSEQIFAWFGGYATTLIHLSNVRRRLYVPACAKRHNLILMQADAAHLSPFSAHEKAMRKGEARSVAVREVSPCLEISMLVNTFADAVPGIELSTPLVQRAVSGGSTEGGQTRVPHHQLAGPFAKHFVPERLPWQVLRGVTRVLQLSWGFVG